MSETFSPLLHAVVSGGALTARDVERAFSLMFTGDVSPVQMAAFLTALKVRGERPEEIAAAAQAMRKAAVSFTGPEGAVDTCGTGGDGANTYNISTAAAIVLSACGVPVAKHGNKAVSSASGSSDVLTALGVDVTIGPARAEACLNEIGLAFLFAPHHHPAVKHVAPVRAALGFRTLFNLLGPLTNPAGARRQLMGVYSKSLCVPIAITLQELGAEAAWVVHGSDGLDELTVTGPSHIAALTDGKITEHTISPEDAGLAVHPAAALKGGSPDENAAALTRLLAGEAGAYRDAVVLNAAAGLVVAGRAPSLRKGASAAAEALASGAAANKLAQMIAVTRRPA